MYSELEPCIECGDCCRIPGMFLPGQIKELARHLSMEPEELFSTYLIAYLWAPADRLKTPSECVTPVFVLAPVKADLSGKRLPQKMYETSYDAYPNNYCIFRDRLRGRCTIDGKKPFECTIRACPRRTRDGAIFLGKSFYYHKWKDSRELLFSICEELKPVYKKLEKCTQKIRKSLEQRNQIMDEEIANLFNERFHQVPICF